MPLERGFTGFVLKDDHFLAIKNPIFCDQHDCDCLESGFFLLDLFNFSIQNIVTDLKESQDKDEPGFKEIKNCLPLNLYRSYKGTAYFSVLLIDWDDVQHILVFKLTEHRILLNCIVPQSLIGTRFNQHSVMLFTNNSIIF